MLGFKLKSPKNFWAGTLYLLLGIGAIVGVHDLPIGKAMKMGPAYFPTVLGGLLIVFGLVACIQSVMIPGQAIGKLSWREVGLVAGAVVLFGLLLEKVGFILAGVLLIVMSAKASQSFRWRSAAFLTIGLLVFSVVVFVKFLGIPLPLLGSWLDQLR